MGQAKRMMEEQMEEEDQLQRELAILYTEQTGEIAECERCGESISLYKVGEEVVKDSDFCDYCNYVKRKTERE